MADAVTALSCPEHGSGCVLQVVTAPRGEVDAPLAHKAWLTEFMVARPGDAVREMRHTSSADAPSRLLLGELIVMPATAEGRINWLERRAERLEAAHDADVTTVADLTAKLAALNARMAEEEATTSRLADQVGDSWHAVGDERLERAHADRGLRDAVDRLEAFVTRRKRWKKAWDG